MTTLLQLGLSNAALATVLALVAALAGWRGRPVLVWGLWLLVLVKLVPPARVRVPLPVATDQVGEVEDESRGVAGQGEGASHLPPLSPVRWGEGSGVRGKERQKAIGTGRRIGSGIGKESPPHPQP